MKYEEDINFNQYEIDGWRCSCGEIYYNSDQAQRILLLNKLRKEKIRAKLGRIRSNLIIRLPKDIENALNLKKGEEVTLRIKNQELIMQSNKI